MKLSYPLLTTLLILSWLQPHNSSASELTYLIIANQAEPFQINSSNYQANSGIISDVVAALANKKNLTITTHVMPFKRYVHEIEKNTYTNWISYGSPLWRLEKQHWAQNKRLSKQALFRAHHSLVQRHDDPTHYAEVEDLFGKTVILLKGFDYPGVMPFIKTGQIKKVDVKSHQSALKALTSKRGDVFIEMDSRIRYALKQHNIDRSSLKLSDVPLITPSLDIHLSFGDEVSQDTIDWIDDQIIIMKANAQLEAIINRYQ